MLQTKTDAKKQPLTVSSATVKKTVACFGTLLESEEGFLTELTLREAAAYILILLREWSWHLADDGFKGYFSHETRRNANTQAHITNLAFLYEDKQGFFNGCMEKYSYYLTALEGKAETIEAYLTAKQTETCSEIESYKLSIQLIDRLGELFSHSDSWITQAAIAYNVIVLGGLQQMEPHKSFRNSFAHPLQSKGIQVLLLSNTDTELETLLSTLSSPYRNNLPDYESLRATCKHHFDQLSQPDVIADKASLQKQYLETKQLYQMYAQTIVHQSNQLLARTKEYEPYIGKAEYPELARLPIAIKIEQSKEKELFQTPCRTVAEIDELRNVISKKSDKFMAFICDLEQVIFSRTCEQARENTNRKNTNATVFGMLFQDFKLLCQRYKKYESRTKFSPPLFLCLNFFITHELLQHWQTLGYDFDKALKNMPNFLVPLIYDDESLDNTSHKEHKQMLLDFMLNAIVDKAWIYKRLFRIIINNSKKTYHQAFIQIIQTTGEIEPPPIKINEEEVFLSSAAYLSMHRRFDYLNLFYEYAKPDIHKAETEHKPINGLSTLFLSSNPLIGIYPSLTNIGSSEIEPINVYDESQSINDLKKFLQGLSPKDLNSTCKLTRGRITLLSFAINNLDVDRMHMLRNNHQGVATIQNFCWEIFEFLLSHKEISKTYALSPILSPFIVACHSANLKVITKILKQTKNPIELQRMLNGCVTLHNDRENIQLLKTIKKYCERLAKQKSQPRSEKDCMEKMLKNVNEKDFKKKSETLMLQQLRANTAFQEAILTDKRFYQRVLSLANKGIIPIQGVFLYKPEYLNQLYNLIKKYHKKLRALQEENKKSIEKTKTQYAKVLSAFQQCSDNPELEKKSSVCALILKQLKNDMQAFRKPLEDWFNTLTDQIDYATQTGNSDIDLLISEQEKVSARLALLQQQPLAEQVSVVGNEEEHKSDTAESNPSLECKLPTLV